MFHGAAIVIYHLYELTCCETKSIFRMLRCFNLVSHVDLPNVFQR